MKNKNPPPRPAISLSLEREQTKAYQHLLLDEMDEYALVRSLERWVLVCHQRGWESGEPPMGKKKLALIDAVLARAQTAADALPDEWREEVSGVDD